MASKELRLMNYFVGGVCRGLPAYLATGKSKKCYFYDLSENLGSGDVGKIRCMAEQLSNGAVTRETLVSHFVVVNQYYSANGPEMHILVSDNTQSPSGAAQVVTLTGTPNSLGWTAHYQSIDRYILSDGDSLATLPRKTTALLCNHLPHIKAQVPHRRDETADRVLSKYVDKCLGF